MSVQPATTRALARIGALTVTAGLIGIAGVGTASAHVTANIYGEQPTKGGYGAIVLRVPNEEANAGTTKIEVSIKPEYGLSSVRTKPVAGWTAEVVKSPVNAPALNSKSATNTEAVTKVIWTAQPGTKIAAGSTEFQEFELTAGPLPDKVDTVLLPTAQTYENGKVVNWSEETPENGTEPEHPAPEVRLAAAQSGGHGHGSGETDSATGNTVGSDTTARWLGGAGLLVGALALGFGLGATFRARKTPSTNHNTDSEA